MPSLNLDQTDQVVVGGLARPRALDLYAHCFADFDSGEYVVALRREDGASTSRSQLAIAKAARPLGTDLSSRQIAGMAAERPTPRKLGMPARFALELR